MKFEFKNLIAFTLSEMMIVLLIVSVISAATIPTITQQKQKPYNVTQNDTTSDEIWKYDDFGGIYTYFLRDDYRVDSLLAKIPLKWVDDLAEASIYLKPTGLETYKDRGQIRFFHKNENTGLIYFGDGNTILMGYEAGYGRLTSGVAIGYYAMAQDENKDPNPTIHTAAGDSVAIGSYAMYRSYVTHNVAIGSYAQYYSNSSESSISVGHCAGSDICEARYHNRRYPEASDNKFQYNVAIGSSAGALGYAAGNYWNNKKKDNISIGFYSGYYFDYVEDRSDIKSNKISIGAYAGFGVPDADTISIGYNAGVRETPKDNRFFDNNISIGYYSGYNDRGTSDAGASNNNIFIGSYAGYLDLYHNYPSNVAIGAHSKIESGEQIPSVAIGYYATAGMGHIALGAYAGYKGASHETSSIIIGRYALSQGSNIVTGKNNIYIGRRASYGNRGIKDESIFIGNEAGSAYNTSAGAGAKGLLIGYGAFSDSRHTRMILPYASKTIVSDTGDKASINAMNFASLIIGPGYGYPGGPSFNKTILAFVGEIYAKNSNFTPFTSDRRSKENIVKSKYGINQIRHINTYTYNYKSDKEKTLKVGVIAQEVQKYIPEAVSKNASGYLCMNFDWLLYPLANAIKDLDVVLITMQKDLIVQSKDLIPFEKRVDKLDKKVSKTLEKQNKMQDKLNATKDILNKMETK